MSDTTNLLTRTTRFGVSSNGDGDCVSFGQLETFRDANRRTGDTVIGQVVGWEAHQISERLPGANPLDGGASCEAESRSVSFASPCRGGRAAHAKLIQGTGL
jgi:hypothetical protein